MALVSKCEIQIASGLVGYPQFGLDILSYIAQYVVWDMSKHDILILKNASHAFHRILLPYLYRHIHFSHFDQANNCLETLSLYPNLRHKVQTLAVSINFIKGGAGGKKGKQTFWALLRRVLPELDTLKCFNIFYYHEDTDALFRWISQGIPSILPGSLQKVSFIPIDHNDDRSLDKTTFPWARAERWAKCVAAFSKIPLLIVTTPTYLFWPPHSAACQKTIERWTSLLPINSLLHIEINSGYEDEGKQAHKYERKHGPAAFDTDYGVKLTIAMKGTEWKIVPCCTHRDQRHYYFFTTWGYGMEESWLHEEDESEDAQKIFVSKYYCR